MNMSFQTRLPCGITSGAQPVKALRFRSDERAPAPHLYHLHGLDWLCSVMSIPHGGDAERAGGRRQRGTHHLRASFTVGTEEVVGTARATPAERAAFPLHAQALKAELVRCGSLAVFSSVADSARCDAACAILDHRGLAEELLLQQQTG